jgi:hypothetical protein
MCGDFDDPNPNVRVPALPESFQIFAVIIVIFLINQSVAFL